MKLYDRPLQGVVTDAHERVNDPAWVVQCALQRWELFASTYDNHAREEFFQRAQWLLEHAVSVLDDARGWLLIADGRYWLSAAVQGGALSILVHAYKLTRETVWLEMARRVTLTFERDILDGGVCAPLANGGVFFEATAVYPAAHELTGCLVGLRGLFEYREMTHDGSIRALTDQAHRGIHLLLDEFDTGFWTRGDLLMRHLTTTEQLTEQAHLLMTLGEHAGCEYCMRVARRWQRYVHHSLASSRAMLLRGGRALGERLVGQARRWLLPAVPPSASLPVCMPIASFPVVGGTRTVIARIAQVTKGSWRITYLAQHVGADADEQTIQQFGSPHTSPWRFPAVWLYELAGSGKLLSLLRQGAGYQMILPQDGTFTAAFAGLIGKLAGVRTVCVDHGNLSVLTSQRYRDERIQSWSERCMFERLAIRAQYEVYWPSLHLLAWLGARLIDHYFVPGAPGDGVEEVCASLGVPASRVTRFANMIDMARFPTLDFYAREEGRQRLEITGEAVVIALVCRLEADKGLELALEAVSQSLAALAPSQREQLFLIIVGNGSLRQQIEGMLHMRGLYARTLMWGEAASEDVSHLLSLSDIFLYTSWRAAGYPLTILEAMAAGCAVIATQEPLANRVMLAEGRGVVVPLGDVAAMSEALTRLVSNPARRQHMGRAARAYVASQHNAEQFKRALLRVTSWSELRTLLPMQPASAGT